MKLTPKQKDEKKRRDKLLYLANKVRSDWSFGKIKVYSDLLQSVGYQPDWINKTYFERERNARVTFQDVKDYLEDCRLSLEAEIFLENNPPDISPYEFDERTSGCDPAVLLQEVSDSKEVATLDPTTTQVPSPTYTLPKCDREKAFLFWFQKKAASQILNNILEKGYQGQQLIAATGYGKTFIMGAVLCRLVDMKFHLGKTYTPWPFVYVTRASVVEQTKRVFEKQFGLDCEHEVLVINIEQLRSSFGERFVKEEIKVEFGEEHVKWKWRPNIFPVWIGWDESQALKNVDSQQSQIAQSYNEIPSKNTYQVFISATPYVRVAEAKCFCVSTRIPYKFGVADKAPLNNQVWTAFSREIADPADPTEYSPAAVDRLTTHMDDYIIRVKGVKPQFRALNSVQMIEFQSASEREFYDKAWERYLEEKDKLEEEAPSNSKFLILVEMLKFSQAAEECRAPYLAKAMWEAVTKHNQAACCAVKFKRTIIKAVKILCYDYNIPRDLISIIWGGGQTVSKKQKQKAKLEQNDVAMQALLDAGITLADIDLDDIDAPPLEELPPELRLGTQNKKERQSEIDKFQKGESLFCFYTFRAGGVGLSLHHTDELTKEKVRHKESGYAFEEDIPSIPTRQRINFVAPTYSAIEMVQGLGRCPRLTSLSDTPQLMIFYRGTIEERIAAIVSMKLKCLTKVVRQKESWEDVIVGNAPVERHAIADVVPDEDDEQIYGDGEGDED